MPSITQNTTRSFLIDVIIRNQDIKKLETTCFGLTLAIFRFHLEKLLVRFVIQLHNNCIIYNCITSYGQLYSFSRWNLKMASVRPKRFVSNFFISWFLIITSIRKLLVVLLTASPYRHLVHYTTGMANLKIHMWCTDTHTSNLQACWNFLFLNAVSLTQCFTCIYFQRNLIFAIMFSIPFLQIRNNHGMSWTSVGRLFVCGLRTFLWHP